MFNCSQVVVVVPGVYSPRLVKTNGTNVVGPQFFAISLLVVTHSKCRLLAFTYDSLFVVAFFCSIFFWLCTPYVFLCVPFF